MTGPLAGLRVVDLTIAGAGPRAGRMLAELGAEVIKIESEINPDVMLTRPPKQRGHPVGYTHYNRGKRAVFLNLRESADRELAYELVRRSDIFLNNMRPGVAERLGVSFEQLQAINPRLIYGYLSAWGREGPLAAWPGADPVVQFFSGWCSIQGEEGGEGEFGRFVGHIDDIGAVLLVGGILQALIDRDRSGRGHFVDASLLRASLAIQSTRIAEHFGGSPPLPLGTASAITAPHEAFRCGDGEYLAVGVVEQRQWRGLCAALGKPELADDPRFATNPDRVNNRARLSALLAEIFATLPSNWWQILLQRHGVPNGRFYDWETIRFHAHVLENDFIRLTEVPHQGPLYLVNPPWTSSRWPRLCLPVERPGEHSEEIIESLRGAPSTAGAAAANGATRVAAAAEPPGRSRPALDGLTVVDATQGLCGPYTSLLLADAGATVIKIEPPEGDYARQMGPPFVGGASVVFQTLNRGKRSVVLDLTTDGGRAELRRLIRSADVFLEDWGPGVAAGLGFDEESLRTEQPALISCSLSAFGEQGPLAHLPGAELVVQAMSEYHLGVGTVGDRPVRVGGDVASTSAAIYAFALITAAVYDRARTGLGNRLALSQYGTLLAIRGCAWVAQADPDDWDGWAARAYYPPDYGYQAKDGKVYYIILRGDQEAFDALMIELGLDEYLADHRFENGGRDAVGIGRYAPEVKPIWESVFRDKTVAELTELVQARGGLIAPLHNHASLFADPRVEPLKLTGEMRLPDGGTLQTLTPPWRFSALPVGLAGEPPALGQHTEEVLGPSRSAPRT